MLHSKTFKGTKSSVFQPGSYSQTLLWLWLMLTPANSTSLLKLSKHRCLSLNISRSNENKATNPGGYFSFLSDECLNEPKFMWKTFRDSLDFLSCWEQKQQDSESEWPQNYQNKAQVEKYWISPLSVHLNCCKHGTKWKKNQVISYPSF